MALTWTHKGTQKYNGGGNLAVSTSSSDEKLVVVCTYWYTDRGTPVIDGITFDGTAMTFSHRQQLTFKTDNSLTVEWWYLDSPGAVTSGAVLIDWDGTTTEPLDDACFAGVINGGVATGGADAEASDSSTSATSLSASLTASGAGLAMMALALENNNDATPGAGWTLGAEYGDGSLFRGEYAYQVIAASGTVTCDWTYSNTEGIVGATFWPEAAGGTDALTATNIATGAPAVGSPTIGQTHALTASTVAVGATVVGTPAIGQVHALTATAVAVGALAVGSPTLAESGDAALEALGVAVGAPVVGAATLGQVHALTATSIALGAIVVGSPGALWVPVTPGAETWSALAADDTSWTVIEEGAESWTSL